MTSKRLARIVAAIGLAIAVGVAGATTGSASTARASKLEGGITVLAASSLTEGFTQLATDFEKAHPDAVVTLSFNASSTLATQIQQGAPADVFASADEANMAKVVDSDDVTVTPTVFARNRLAIAVERGNPEHITSLADTVASDVTLVLCAPEVPCGKFALEAYAKAGVKVPAVPYAANVKDAATKVQLGEADAAVVYTTDVKAAKGDVGGVKIPTADNVLAVYPLAPLAASKNPPLAKAFVEYVVSAKGQQTLRRFGFLPPA